jgi:CheY-like chemotaxis protein
VKSVPPSLRPPPTIPLRILYVDDSSAQLFQARDALQQAGHQVSVTSDIPSAQKLVADKDMVILDWHMPEMNGGLALRALKRSAGADPRTVYYMYTIDVAVAADYGALGFDGAFTGKGSLASLVAQVDKVARLIKLRRFMSNKTSAK